MNYNFYIVDDDKSIIRMLEKIIINNNLGDVVGKSETGVGALDDIFNHQVDILLVDLLLPNIDGIKLASKILAKRPNLTVIMISEVSSKEMVSKAYNKGIEYYINKPLNVIEIKSIIQRVHEKLEMKKVIKSFKNAFSTMSSMDIMNDEKPKRKGDTHNDIAKRIMSNIGIHGESGTRDILNIIAFVMGDEDGEKKKLMHFKLSDLYNYIHDKYEIEGNPTNVKTVEQRIRRAINKALNNVANIGIDDFSNETFNRYSKTLFDYQEVRKEMDYIKGISSYSGKISVKKFIEGIIVEVEHY